MGWGPWGNTILCDPYPAFPQPEAHNAQRAAKAVLLIKGSHLGIEEHITKTPSNHPSTPVNSNPEGTRYLTLVM